MRPATGSEAHRQRAEAFRAAIAAAPIAIDGERVAPEPSIGLAALARGMLIHDDLLRAALDALPTRARAARHHPPPLSGCASGG